MRQKTLDSHPENVLMISFKRAIQFRQPKNTFSLPGGSFRKKLSILLCMKMFIENENNMKLQFFLSPSRSLA